MFSLGLTQKRHQWTTAILEEEVEHCDGGPEAGAEALAEAGDVEVARHQDEGHDDVDDGHGLGRADHVAHAAAAARHPDAHLGCLSPPSQLMLICTEVG